MPEEPSLVRKQLARELVRLRSLAGLSGRQMAKAIEVSQPTMSRIDNATSLPSRSQVEKWLAAADAPADARAQVLALTEAAHRETLRWKELFGDNHAQLQEHIGEQERAAAIVRNFQPTVIPGLLQTPPYHRRLATLSVAAKRTSAEIEAIVKARAQRQQLLYEDGRRFEFLIHENVLRWAPGPDVMKGQLDRLMSALTLDSVELAVVPSSAAVATPWHNFVIQAPAEGGPPFVVIEEIHGEQTVTDPDAVALYVEMWERLWKAAAVGDEAASLIREIWEARP